MPPSPSFAQTAYHLRWHGQQEGPFTLEQIRQRLDDGKIGRLHEVLVQGRWTTLGDHLEAIDRQRLAEEQSRRAQQEERRQMALRQDNASSDLRQQTKLVVQGAGQLAGTPRFSSGPVGYSGDNAAASNQQASSATGGRQPTSGLAVAAFVMSLLFFIPFVNFVSWLLAIIFGHIALANIRAHPAVGGRGLALAALYVTYGLLALGLIVGLLLAAGGHALHL